MFSQLIWMINFAVRLAKKGANCLPIEMVSWDVVDAQCIIAVIVVGWFFGFVRQNRHTFCFAAWFNSGTWLESFANNLASLFLQLLFCLSDTQNASANIISLYTICSHLLTQLAPHKHYYYVYRLLISVLMLLLLLLPLLILFIYFFRLSFSLSLKFRRSTMTVWSGHFFWHWHAAKLELEKLWIVLFAYFIRTEL